MITLITIFHQSIITTGIFFFLFISSSFSFILIYSEYFHIFLLENSLPFQLWVELDSTLSTFTGITLLPYISNDRSSSYGLEGFCSICSSDILFNYLVSPYEQLLLASSLPSSAKSLFSLSLDRDLSRSSFLWAPGLLLVPILHY